MSHDGFSDGLIIFVDFIKDREVYHLDVNFLPDGGKVIISAKHPSIIGDRTFGMSKPPHVFCHSSYRRDPLHGSSR